MREPKTETVEASEVGLEVGASLPFVFRPGVRASPLVVSFPHVGLEWPEELGPRPQVNFARNADYAVDRLYVRAGELGAATVRARYSRLVVDLNRAEDDVSQSLVPDHPAPNPRASTSSLRSSSGARRPIRNRGVVWASAIGNIPLFETLPHARFADRIARYHRPYYRALALLLERRVERFGYAILLDAHSMPGIVSGDLVLGTRSGSACSPAVRDLAIAALSGRRAGAASGIGSRWPLEVAVDDPYRGGAIVEAFGRPEAQIHALQLEIDRSIYMDEFRLELHELPDPRVTDGADLGARARLSRVAQSETRDQRRLRALVRGLDDLVAELSLEREPLADRTAAE